MEITRKTKVGDLFAEYGDLAEVMEALGVTRIPRLSIRRLLARLITVEQAARLHRMPVDELVEKLRIAVAMKSKTGESS
jgi:hypothetical protein